MWALEWVLREGRWQIVVGGVVSAAAQRLNEPPHVTLLPRFPDPAGVGLACRALSFPSLLSLPMVTNAPIFPLPLFSQGRLYPWLGRQKSPNSMTFSVMCLFPKDHAEGPRNTADANLTVTLWSAVFATLCELCQLSCVHSHLNKASVGGGEHPTSRN